MAEAYYQPSPYSPLYVKAVVDRFRIYICELLYGTDYAVDPAATIFNKTIIADIGAGNPNMVGEAVEQHLDTFSNPPFTTYAPEAVEEILEKANTAAAIGTFYCPDIPAYVAAWPMKFSIQTVSFFGTSADYWRAMSILTYEKITLSRLKVPVLINGNPVDITATLGYQISKGSYAGAFEEYLRQQDLWDLVVTFTLEYYELRIFHDAANTLPQPAFGEFVVYPIDEMILRLNRENQQGDLIIQENLIVATLVEVTSTSPIEAAAAVPVNTPVVINFSLPMVPESVENSLSIIPFRKCDLAWSSNDTVLTLTPRQGWLNNTAYKIDLVAETSVGGLHQHPLEEDLLLNFTTEP